jgi:hypothetical protein
MEHGVWRIAAICGEEKIGYGWMPVGSEVVCKVVRAALLDKAGS